MSVKKTAIFLSLESLLELIQAQWLSYLEVYFISIEQVKAGPY